MNTSYGSFKVLCKVSGGVTGTRIAYLKDAKGVEKIFATKEAAETEASALNRKMNGNPHRTATFRYQAVEYDF